MKTTQRSQRRKMQSIKRVFIPRKPKPTPTSTEDKQNSSTPTSTVQAPAGTVKKKDVIKQDDAVGVDSGAPKPEPRKEIKYRVKSDKGQDAILISLERSNRMAVRWPAKMTAFTEQLEEETSAIGRLLGRIEDLKGDGKKKLIPLNYYNARKVLTMLKGLHQMKRPDGERLYSVTLTEDFAAWYHEEHQAKKLCDDALHLLEYDDDSIQTEFDFLKKPLYPWQSAGMRFIDAITRHGKGAFVCDETGLGKTYTVVGHLASIKAKAVAVVPANLTESWARKVRDISDLSVYVIEGKKYPMDLHTYDIIVVSYKMLNRHGLWPLCDIVDGQQRVLILDEGHYAKNYKSRRTKNALDLGTFAKHTIVMTATPLKNRENELHPLLRIMRRLWTEESMDDFSNYYTTPEGREEIAERLSKFMIRRMFKEVKPDFPVGEVGHAWLELTNRGDYDEAEKNFIEWLIRQGADSNTLESAERGKALVKLNRLRQMSANGKIEAAAKIIERTMDAGEQVVVFCAFREPLRALTEYFSEKTGTNHKGQNWKGSAIICSGVSKKKRYQHIDDFMDGKLGLLCIGVGAGGMGIDLPIARFAYFLDLPWNPADFEQCTGRLLRLGQTRNCQFIKLLADKSIDQRMEEIIQGKAKIFEEAIGDVEIVDRVTAKDADRLQQSVVSMLIASYIKDALAA